MIYHGDYSAVMRYAGNFSAVNGFSFFDGNGFGGNGNTPNMPVNRQITVSGYQDGNFTAVKLPRSTLKNYMFSSSGRNHNQTGQTPYI